MKNTETKSERRGRPIKSDSARQLRLNRFAEMKASGITVKRGRPAKVVDPNAPVVEKVAKVKTPKVKAAKPIKSKTTQVKTDQPVVLSEGANHKTVSHPTGKPVTYVKSKDIMPAQGKGFNDVPSEDEIEIEDIHVDEFKPEASDLEELGF